MSLWIPVTPLMMSLVLTTSEMPAKSSIICYRDCVMFLLSGRGPSRFLSEQISGRKFYYDRFTAEVGKQYNPRATRVNLPGGIDIGNQGATACMSFWNAMLDDEYKQSAKPGNTSSLPQVPSTIIPKSVSVAALLPARKVVSPPNVARVILELGSYVVADKQWVKSMKLDLYKENNAFAEGGFRHAFLATVRATPTDGLLRSIR